MELFSKFRLPLLCQMRWTEYCQTGHFPSIEKFPGCKACLYGLANAHVIGNEKAHRVQLEGHKQRHELVGPGIYTDLGKGTKRAAACSKSQTDGIPQKTAGTEIPYLGWIGKRKGGRLNRLQGKIDSGNFIIHPAQWA